MNRITPSVLAVARRHRLNRDDQLDIVQDGWLLLVINLHTIRDPAALRSWLATTVGRLASQTRCQRDREGRRAPAAVAQELPGSAPPAEQLWFRGHRDRVLWAMVANLPREERTLIELLAHEPRPSCRRLAERMGVSTSGAARIRARALRRLRHLLAAEGITTPA